MYIYLIIKNSWMWLKFLFPLSIPVVHFENINHHLQIKVE